MSVGAEDDGDPFIGYQYSAVSGTATDLGPCDCCPDPCPTANRVCGGRTLKRGRWRCRVTAASGWVLATSPNAGSPGPCTAVDPTGWCGEDDGCSNRPELHFIVDSTGGNTGGTASSNIQLKCCTDRDGHEFGVSVVGPGGTVTTTGNCTTVGASSCYTDPLGPSYPVLSVLSMSLLTGGGEVVGVDATVEVVSTGGILGGPIVALSPRPQMTLEFRPGRCADVSGGGFMGRAPQAATGPCRHRSDEWSVAKSAANLLDPRKRWALCLSPDYHPVSQPVCPCSGCGPVCPGYSPTFDD